MLIGACASGHEGGGGKAMEAGVARVVHAAASGICCCGRKRTAGSGSLQLPDSPVRNWGFYCVRKEAEDVCSRGNLAVGRWVWVRCGCDVGVVKDGWEWWRGSWCWLCREEDGRNEGVRDGASVAGVSKEQEPRLRR